MTASPEGTPSNQSVGDWLREELTRRGLDIPADASQTDMTHAIIDYDDYQRNLAELRSAGVTGDFTPDEAREIVYQRYMHQLRKANADGLYAATGLELSPDEASALQSRAVGEQILGMAGAATFAEAAEILEAQIQAQTGDHMVYSEMGTQTDKYGGEWTFYEGPEGEPYWEYHEK